MAACGADDAVERTVTADEAARLSDTLFANFNLGGAEFELSARMSDGAEVRMSGTIDWREHSGRATVDVTGTPDSLVTEVIWGGDVVVERIPRLTDLLASRGRPQAVWFARPPEPEQRHIDSMIEILTALASEQRENAVLIEQEPGTAWLRSDTTSGDELPVDVFSYGGINRYWLSEADVLMLRFEGNNASGTRPVLVDLREHGRKQILVPVDEQVIPVDEVVSSYVELTASLDR